MFESSGQAKKEDMLLIHPKVIKFAYAGPALLWALTDAQNVQFSILKFRTF